MTQKKIPVRRKRIPLIKRLVKWQVVLAAVIAGLSTVIASIVSSGSASNSVANKNINSSRSSRKSQHAVVHQPVDASQSGSPVQKLSIVSIEPIILDGTVYTFPQKLTLNAKVLFHSNLYGLGGYPNTVDTQLTLRNNSSYPARINNMRVIENCQAPYRGTIILAPPQGGPDNVQLGFDLDSTNPDARVSRGTVVVNSEPDYFARRTRTINPDQETVLNLMNYTAKHACTYRYLLTGDIGGHSFGQVIGNGDQPFRIGATEIPLSSNPAPLGHYKAAYVGGEFIPTREQRGNPGLVGVNPQSYTYPGP
jgi:hypothetical protein